MLMNKTTGFLAGAAAFTLFACQPDGNDLGLGDKVGSQPTPELGQSSFFSADAEQGQAAATVATGAAEDGRAQAAPAFESNADAAAPERSVEEGDIYRMLPASRTLLNLNAYRGLQLIGLEDPAHPRIVGRVATTGTPVEMYAAQDRVYVLLNNWQAYYGSRADLRPTSYRGGVVLVVDVQNPKAPKVISRGEVPGWIRTSRMTRGSGKDALFVVANDGNETYVKSFGVSADGVLEARSQIRLGGYVTDIQATADRLLVARYDWQKNERSSEVSVINIADPDGNMVEGESVQVWGFVASKHNMNLEGDVLRVVSGNSWRTRGDTNHVQTFDASNIKDIRPIDHQTFGDGENLFATLFLRDRAFFVTYRRVDPFHTFLIDRQGMISEESEFIVSGWNDFFRPVYGDTRLIGIGKNDENGVKLAVSLYDVVDPNNLDPLLKRREIDLAGGWSEANWDDRAFSVLENATEAVSAKGVVETGLVLLPFSGWDENSKEYVSAVQIFTFSEETLTRRGVMQHGTRVRRSFQTDAAEAIVGNLSEASLSLFDAKKPDAPQELGRVELAPNYQDFWVFGNHGVRRRSDREHYGWWGARGEARADVLEVVSLSDDVDAADSVAQLSIPSDASVYPSRDRLVVVTQTQTATEKEDGKRQSGLKTHIAVYSFSDPLRPQLVGELTTDSIPASGGGYGSFLDLRAPIAEDCFDCGGGWYGRHTALATDNALVFSESVSEREVLGVETVRVIYPGRGGCSSASQGGTDAPSAPEGDAAQPAPPLEPEELPRCDHLTGSIHCSSVRGSDGALQPEVCTGALYRCTDEGEGKRSCEEVDPSEVPVQTREYQNEKTRWWTHQNFHIVDLSGAKDPILAPSVQMEKGDEWVSNMVRGSDLYVSYKRPGRRLDDPRPYVQHFFRRLALEQPSQAVFHAPVNVPGQLIEVDGSTLLTRDAVWGENMAETTINRLTVRDGRAFLDGVRRFENRFVQEVQVDGAGHVLVSHQPNWWFSGVAVSLSEPPTKDRVLLLSVLDLGAKGLEELAVMEVDEWASLRASLQGRALFSVPGGMLVVNLDDVSQPYAQAYFPLQGWPSANKIHDRTVYVPAGRHGLYTFGLDAFNLLTRASN